MAEEVRYGLYHGRPRELLTNVALCWRVSKSRAKDPRRAPKEPGTWLRVSKCQEGRRLVLAEGMDRAAFKDSKGRFGLARVRVGCPERLVAC